MSFSLIDLVFEVEDGKEHAVIGNNVWKQEEVVAIVRNREVSLCLPPQFLLLVC